MQNKYKIEPDILTLSYLILCCGSNHQLEKAIEVADKIKQYDLIPTKYFYIFLICACIASNNLE